MEVYLQTFVYYSKLNPGLLGSIKPTLTYDWLLDSEELTVLYLWDIRYRIGLGFDRISSNLNLASNPLIIIWFSLTALINFLFSSSRQSSDKPTEHYLSSVKQQTDTVRDQLVNIVQHLAAKAFSRGGRDQNRVKRVVNIGLKFISWTHTRLNDHVTPCLLDV